MKRSAWLAPLLALTLLLSGCAGLFSEQKEEEPKTDFRKAISEIEEQAEEAEEGPVDPDHVKDENGFERDARGYIMDYDGRGGSIMIPSSIRDMDIVGIGFHAFYENEDITDVTIPDTVTHIDVGAFESCAGLKKVTFPDSVEIIDDSAFEDCPNLKNVVLPKSCTSVGEDAFKGSGAGTFLGNAAVYGQLCFEESTFDKISFAPGADISERCMFMGAKVKEIEFPSDMEALGESAFSHCETVEKIVLPNSVHTLGEGVFSDMGLLSVLKLSENLKELPKDMTSGTTTDVVVIPEGVERICSGAIYDAALVVLTNPAAVIEEHAIDAGYVHFTEAKDYVFPPVNEEQIFADRMYLDDVYAPEEIQGDFYAATSIETQLYLPVDATVEQSNAMDVYLQSVGYPEISWICGIHPAFLPEDTIGFDLDGDAVTGYHGESKTLSVPWYVIKEDDGFFFRQSVFSIRDHAFSDAGFKKAFLRGGFEDGVGSGILSGNPDLSEIWFNMQIVQDMDLDVYAADAFAGVPDNVKVYLPITIPVTLQPVVEEFLISVGIPEGASFQYYMMRQ